MSNEFIVVVILVLLALLIPMHLDPAIRLRDWLERRRGR